MLHVLMKRYAAYAVLTWVGFTGSVMAQQLPDTIDLRAAYCARLLAKQTSSHKALMTLIPNMPEGETKRAIVARQHEMEDRHRRLLAYLLPRLKYLDPGPLVAASETADADVATNTRVSEDAGCASMALQDAVACVAIAQAKSPIAIKQQQCADVDWLPF